MLVSIILMKVQREPTARARHRVRSGVKIQAQGTPRATWLLGSLLVRHLLGVNSGG